MDLEECMSFLQEAQGVASPFEVESGMRGMGCV